LELKLKIRRVETKAREMIALEMKEEWLKKHEIPSRWRDIQLIDPNEKRNNAFNTSQGLLI